MGGNSDVIENVLEELSKNPDAIISLLKTYEYEKFKCNSKEIRFARNNRGGLNISIRLEDNQACLVKDFVTGECNNIINFIMAQRNAQFKDVLQAIKSILHLDIYWEPKKRVGLFGGIFDNIGVKKEFYQYVYDEDVLKMYEHVGNKLWLKDGISLKIQREFDICFDTNNETIIIPWRNQFGELIAVKNRINGAVEDGMSKYYYSKGGNISLSLYGYCENYRYLQNTDVFIGESEKFVLQLASMGYRNAISLGSNSLSQQQAALILSLNPKRVIWLLDEGLDKKHTFKNANTLKEYCAMREVKQAWWNWEESLSVENGSKMSPSDCSKEIFDDIIQYELEDI